MGYPSRNGGRAAPNKASQSERVDTLLGDRGKASPELRAVIRQDAADAGTIALQSAIVTAAPTAEQHNALVQDIRDLAAVLNRMGANFTWR